MKYLCFVILTATINIPVAFGQQDGRSTQHVFPQFADGRFVDGSFYKSTVLVSNPNSAQASSCSLILHGMTTVFQDASGNFGVLSPEGISFTLLGGQYDVLTTIGITNFQSGYVTISCTQEINAQVLYGSYSPKGLKVSEATVFSSAPASILQIIGDQRESGRLGVAITNDSGLSVRVDVLAANTTGQTVGQAQVTIPAWSTMAVFVDELMSIPPNYIGQILISGKDDARVSVIGMRFTGAAFTTMPATVRIQ